MNNSTMLPILKIIPIVGVSLFASSFFLMTEKSSTFQSAFDKASTADAPKAELSDFAEFPDVSSVIRSELKARNEEMRKCTERKRCVFLMAYSEVLLNRIKVLDEGEDPLAYLKRKYGSEAYEYVKENRDLLEMKFDERFTAQILRRTNGKILSVDNGFSREEVRKTYEDYVVSEALPELLESLSKAESPKMKALYEYEISFLLSDTRLISSK